MIFFAMAYDGFSLYESTTTHGRLYAHLYAPLRNMDPLRVSSKASAASMGCDGLVHFVDLLY